MDAFLNYQTSIFNPSCWSVKNHFVFPALAEILGYAYPPQDCVALRCSAGVQYGSTAAVQDPTLDTTKLHVKEK